MKTASIVLRSAIALCFAFVMSSASCDLFDKVDDVTFETTFSHTFNVNETQNGTNVNYELKELLDAADLSADFKKYENKIKSITVTSVTYVIQNCSDGAIVNDATVGFAATSATTASQIASLGVDNLKAIEGQTKTLTYSQAQVDALSNLLKTDKKANIFLNATIAKTPVKFDAQVTVKATIVANAL